MQKSVRHLLHLLATALNQDRMERGDWTMNPEPVDPAELCAQVVSCQEIDPAKHRIRLECAGLPATIQASSAMLSILLTNLLENAVRYSPAGGEIIVRGQAWGEAGVRIEVVDPGIGIASEDQEQVFQRFFRVGALAGVEGSGLGLYLARNIARLHGGELTVLSRPGSGSTFILQLPGAIRM
jgi:signal transduction histidine kinase